MMTWQQLMSFSTVNIYWKFQKKAKQFNQFSSSLQLHILWLTTVTWFHLISKHESMYVYFKYICYLFYIKKVSTFINVLSRPKGIANSKKKMMVIPKYKMSHKRKTNIGRKSTNIHIGPIIVLISMLLS